MPLEGDDALDEQGQADPRTRVNSHPIRGLSFNRAFRRI